MNRFIFFFFCVAVVQDLETKAAKAQEAFEAEEKKRKELEASLAKANMEKADLMGRLSGETNVVQEMKDKNAKLLAQKGDVESQLAVSVLVKIVD